jgi:hypothetical protein
LKHKRLKTGAFAMSHSSVWGKEEPPLQAADLTVVVLDRLPFWTTENQST